MWARVRVCITLALASHAVQAVHQRELFVYVCVGGSEFERDVGVNQVHDHPKCVGAWVGVGVSIRIGVRLGAD